MKTLRPITPPSKSGRYALWAAIVILSLWVAMLLFQLGSDTDSTTRGQFGDSFGSLNTLFTGLAFVGVAYSIRLQREEANKRQEEFEAEKAEREREYAKRDREIEFSKQQRKTELETAEKDRIKSDQRAARVEAQRRFDDHFFRHADTRRALITSLSISKGEAFFNQAGASGRAVFEFILNDIKEWIRQNYIGTNDTAAWIRAYDAIYIRYEHALGPYFRVCYQIFKYLKERCPDDKYMYAHLIRAEFSSVELALHALNSQSLLAKRFLPHYDEYSLLKHLVPATFDRIVYEKHISGEPIYIGLRQRLGEDAFTDRDERAVYSIKTKGSPNLGAP